MRSYILRRLLFLIPILLGVTFISFLLITLTPGDYLDNITLDPGNSVERIEQMRIEFGLDKPWYVQYGLWLYRLSPYEFPFGVKWPNFGYSFAYRSSVLTLMGERFWNTLLLTISAEVVVWLVSIPLALFLVSRRNSWLDTFFSSFLVLGISLPQILLSLIALLLAAKTGWFPIGGMQTFGIDSQSFWYRFGDLMHHLLLPALVLGITEVAVLIRYTRRSMMDALSARYVHTARAKGLSEKKILRKHVFPNSIHPLLTLLGLSFANLLSASLIVEIIMGWPGLGRLAYDAMLSEDLYLLMASLTAGTVLLVLGNLLADMLLAVFDPRIRYE